MKNGTITQNSAMKSNQKERCECCSKTVKHPIWLEYSQTDGAYYVEVPVGHISQGFFPFGQTCVKKIVCNLYNLHL